MRRSDSVVGSVCCANLTPDAVDRWSAKAMAKRRDLLLSASFPEMFAHGQAANRNDGRGTHTEPQHRRHCSPGRRILWVAVMLVMAQLLPVHLRVAADQSHTVLLPDSAPPSGAPAALENNSMEVCTTDAAAILVEDAADKDVEVRDQELSVKSAAAGGPVTVSAQAAAIHDSGFLFDGHNDLPWEIREKANSSFDVLDISQSQPRLHTDIPRLRKGGVKAQFWSVYVPSDTAVTGDALSQTLAQISIVTQMMRRYPETFELAGTAADVERIVKSGRIASMMGVEGGHSIENELQNLHRLYDLGCRYMTLTHSKSLSWADSATDDPRANGLSEFGKDVIREMNRLGMLVDLSHVSPETMRQALAVTAAPVMFSHSSARAINSHARNVPDEMLKLTASNGGVVMVNFFSAFVVPTSTLAQNDKAAGTIYDVVDHIEHIIQVAGEDHVGIGSDFDGVPRLPDQLEDVASYPRITQILLDRGHSQERIHKLLGGNIMRVLKRAEVVAAELRRETP